MLLNPCKHVLVREMLTALLCDPAVIPVEPTSIPLLPNLNGVADIIVVALRCLEIPAVVYFSVLFCIIGIDGEGIDGRMRVISLFCCFGFFSINFPTSFCWLVGGFFPF